MHMVDCSLHSPPGPKPGMTVYEINDLAGLDKLRGAWAALLGETAGATFFQSLDWLEVYWRHFGPGGRLRVLVVESSGQIAGIVPLVVRTRRRYGQLPVLCYPRDDGGSFYGPIGPNPRATLAVAANYLRSAPRDWDLVELAWVDGSCARTGEVADALAAGGMPTAAEHYL